MSRNSKADFFSRRRSASPTTSHHQTGPFRFKGQSTSSSHTHNSSRPHRGPHHSSHSHRKSHRRSRSPESDSSMRAHRCYRTTTRSPQPAEREVSPDTAFRESLFDAMADDEGAAYWEGVYGQPVHIYPPPGQSGETYEGKDYDDPNVLDADAYAAYVRRKMWEKSHEHILEERRRREGEAEKRDRARQEEERLRRDYDGRGSRFWDGLGTGGTAGTGSFAEELDRGLKRGKERREEKKWRTAWAEYTQKWDDLLEGARKVEHAGGQPGGERSFDTVAQLPWPVLSGNERDVKPDTVRAFLRKVPKGSTGDGEAMTNALRAQLKTERVRWHPDKVMQRFAVDEKTLQTVTSVFQVIDDMWSVEKSRP